MELQHGCLAGRAELPGLDGGLDRVASGSFVDRAKRSQCVASLDHLRGCLAVAGRSAAGDRAGTGGRGRNATGCARMAKTARATLLEISTSRGHPLSGEDFGVRAAAAVGGGGWRGSGADFSLQRPNSKIQDPERDALIRGDGREAFGGGGWDGTPHVYSVVLARTGGHSCRA